MIENMENKIFGIIAKIADIELDEIHNESLLEDDLGMDSLMIIDLSFEIENIRGSIVTAEEITDIKSVADVISLLN